MRRMVAATAILLLAGCGSHTSVVTPTTIHRPPPRRTTRRRDAVPILMYHVIGKAAANTPYPGLYVDPADFVSEVRWLSVRSYHAVTLAQVYEHWSKGHALPRKPVVFSFDDGNPGDVAVALPTLRSLHWPAVLNLRVGDLVPARVRELIRAGWEIDAHTLTHPDLTTVGPVRLQREVAGSRRWIRGVFHVPVLFFCYPSGRYNAKVVAAVRAAGYLGATTTRFGLARSSEGMFTLSRVRVDGTKGLAGFVSALRRAASGRRLPHRSHARHAD